jgi:hypothetical protein
MTARAIGVFALVLAMASPALAGPENSVIGAKKLEQDMVHSGGVGYPSMTYEWWNKGKKNLDWGLGGDLVYGGSWGAATTNRTNVSGFTVRSSRFIKIGLGINGILRWHLVEKERPKVTNDVGILFKPGVLIGGNTGDTFTFGIKGEVGVPVSIDVHERVSVVTGGYIPFTYLINSDPINDLGLVPLLVRLGIEIKANENVAPWFYFDLGPGIGFGPGRGGADASFAWRIGAGTAFWGVMGKNKNKSDSAATASAE